MYTLRPDEKTTPVILYKKESLVRGEVVTKQTIQRISIWPRTDGVPKYMHLLKAQLLVLSRGPGKTLSFSEIFTPTSELIGYHILPPAEEILDFDPNAAFACIHDIGQPSPGCFWNHRRELTVWKLQSQLLHYCSQLFPF